MKTTIFVELSDLEYEVEVNLSDTVDSLKSIIQKKTRVNKDLQCLIHNKKILQNPNKKISKIIHKGKTLRLAMIGKTLDEFLTKFKGLTHKELLAQLEIDEKFSYSTDPFSDGSYMIVKEIEKNGNCLYAAIHYSLAQNENSSYYLREAIKNAVENGEGQNFFENQFEIDKFLANVLTDGFWGGEFEISLLADFLHIRISVIIQSTLTISTYGSPNTKKIFLLFTGSHYNLLYRNFLNGDPDMDVTRFSDTVQNEFSALSAAQNFKLKKEYDELSDFYCNGCSAVFHRKSEALAHTNETKHSTRSVNV